MMPGMPERRTHDYVRHGVTSLFAAFNIADGTVISSWVQGVSATPRSFGVFRVLVDSSSLACCSDPVGSWSFTCSS